MATDNQSGSSSLVFDPVAVVDIGSNSVRLMVYDGLRRSPAPLFNEKAICALGRGVALTGRLASPAMDRALRTLKRFRALSDQIGADTIYAMATAAVRDAENGSEFVERAERALGSRIEVLPAAMEGHLSGLGVLCAIPDADGIAGDLGGGSLELVELADGRIGQGVTLPIGPLRLIDMAEGSIDKAETIVAAAMEDLPVLDRLRDRTFYAVGGTWRNLFRLQMAQHQYPLSILHQYDVSRTAAQSIAGLVAGLSTDTLKGIDVIPKDRAETLPFGALVLEQLLKRSRARNVVVSAFGLREGMLFSKLPQSVRDDDPLLSACWDYARLRARSPEHALELCAWTDQLFGGDGLAEEERERRLRHAACMLADIGWRAHPDYRAERSFSIISQAAFVGVDHPGRVFLALTVFHRYEGIWTDKVPAPMAAIAGEDLVFRARVLSAAQRLAYVLSAAMPGLLPTVRLQFIGKEGLRLSLPRSREGLVGERVEKRFAELCMLIGRKPEITLHEGEEPVTSPVRQPRHQANGRAHAG